MQLRKRKHQLCDRRRPKGPDTTTALSRLGGTVRRGTDDERPTVATPGDVAFLPPFARASRKGAPPLKNDFAFSFPFPYAGAPVLQFPFSRGCFVCCSLLRRPFVPCLFRLPNSAFRSVLPVGSRESRQGSRVGKEQHSLPWLRGGGGEGGEITASSESQKGARPTRQRKE